LPLKPLRTACLLGIHFCIILILHACWWFFVQYNKCTARLKPVKTET
jgi:hypothetical protein